MKLYSFDKVQYHSTIELAKLRPFIHTNSFQELFFQNPKSNKAKGNASFHYKSWFSGRPKHDNFFAEASTQLLDLEINNSGGTLTYLEIACDTVCKTEQEAINAYLKLEKTAYFAYQDVTCNIIFREKLDKGFFYEKTLYLGKQGHFELAIYPRFHKDTNQPVLRREFRINDNSPILKKIGVTHESEILNPKIIFQNLEAKFFRIRELNYKKIEWLMKYRDCPLKFASTCEFRKFYKAEQKDSKSQSPRYEKKLDKPFQYYLK